MIRLYYVSRPYSLPWCFMNTGCNDCRAPNTSCHLIHCTTLCLKYTCKYTVWCVALWLRCFQSNAIFQLECGLSPKTMYSMIFIRCLTLLLSTVQSCGKKGIVYDFFNQYCPSVLVTNSAYWVNFDAGYDSSCSGKQCQLHFSAFSIRCRFLQPSSCHRL